MARARLIEDVLQLGGLVRGVDVHEDRADACRRELEEHAERVLVKEALGDAPQVLADREADVRVALPTLLPPMSSRPCTPANTNVLTRGLEIAMRYCAATVAVPPRAALEICAFSSWYSPPSESAQLRSMRTYVSRRTAPTALALLAVQGEPQKRLMMRRLNESAVSDF